MRTAADVARTARTVGGRVVETAEVYGRGGRSYTMARVIVPGDGWDTARVLERLAEEDARDPEIVACARMYRASYPRDAELARELHAFVRDSVTFVPEEEETFQSARYTLFESGEGDCDDSARALYALARAAGLRVRLAYLARAGQPAHVFSQIAHDGRWHDAETTIAAHYAEFPLDAAKRLGKGRSDLAGRVVTLQGVVTADAMVLETGDHVRMALAMREAKELAGADPADAVRGILTDMGFGNVVAYDDPAKLPDVWPAAQRAMTETFPAWMAWAEGTWTGSRLAIPRQNPDFIVRAAELFQDGGGAGRGTLAPPPVVETRDIDPDFFPALVALGKHFGVRATELAAVLFSESNGLRPHALNPGAAVGINQFSTYRDNGKPSVFDHAVPGLSETEYLALPASKQLPFVAKFWQGLVGWRGAFGSARDLYWMNFLPATYPGMGAPEEHLITAEPTTVLDNLGLVHPEDRVSSAAISAARDLRHAHAQGQRLDEKLPRGAAGVIRARGLSNALRVAQVGQPSRWREIVARLEAAGDGKGGGAATGAVLAAVGAGIVWALLRARGIV